ncbi:hypothetical protein XENOCAPTIV_010183, partial [Xenoophorus captivus]
DAATVTCGQAVISLCLFPDELKTLMFFDGCPPHLGCSIKLRGASEYELARVKDIIMMMVCVAYHSQLEISFLMDEFAMPPSLPQSSSFPCLLEGSATDEEMDGDSTEKTAVSENSTLGEQSVEALFFESSTKNEDLDLLKDIQNPQSALFSVQEEAENTEMRTSSPYSSPVRPPLSICPQFLIEEEQEVGSHTLVGTSEGEMGGKVSLGLEDEERSLTPTPKMFRDPLQDDTGMFIAEHVDSSDDRLKSISAVFKHELKDIILCISPFITFKEPFLLTPGGMHCPSRDYFPEEDLKELDGRRKRQLLKDSAPSSLVNGQTNGTTQPRPTDVLPCHGLTTTCIVGHLSSSQDLARMLADYRAKGGRIRQKETGDPFGSAGPAAAGSSQNRVADIPVKVLGKADSEEEKSGKQGEMQLNQPQSVSVSVCFTVRLPSRPSYQCPSMFCETPMVHHIRRFVHGSGCVQIVLKELDSPVPGYQHTILNYSWCRICKQVTPVVPLSNDSWSMSFAKYLELRFYGHLYTRRANAEPCGHSIHKDYHQYFSYNQMVASFRLVSFSALLYLSSSRYTWRSDFKKISEAFIYYNSE